MQPKLQTLPVELLGVIIDHLPSKKDTRSLWLALWGLSMSFRNFLASRVFETLTIRAKEQALLQLDARPYTSLDAKYPLDCLKWVKHIHLRAPFHEKLTNDRLPHADLYGRLPVDPFTGRQPYGTYARVLKLIPLFLQLQEKGLISFSWDLGICIPEHILGREGYLTKRQTAIESLSLITGVYIPSKLQDLATQTVVLSNFPRLKKFSWKGLSMPDELDSLRGFFASNYQILEDLELDFISWDLVRIGGKYAAASSSAKFANLILPHGSDRTIRMFASLQRLALSAFGFENMTLDITQAFNISHLRSLKLHNCPGILTFLSTIVEAHLVLKLKSLEFIIKDHAVEHDGVLHSPLISFLESFDGLEDLYLTLQADPRTPGRWPTYYWNAILHHRSTLKRLIYHERIYSPSLYRHQDLMGRGGTANLWVDNVLLRRDPNLSKTERVLSYNYHFYNTALSQMQLECFGVADDPENIQAIMRTPLAVEQNFKLLHIRRTGSILQIVDGIGDVTYEDQIQAVTKLDSRSLSRNEYLRQMMLDNKVFRVAVLIFQSKKFKNLQVLAFGDFSHGNRFKGCNLLLCRAVTRNPQVKFRVMSSEDTAFYKRIGVLSLEFLAACPREALLDRRRGNGEFA